MYIYYLYLPIVVIVSLISDSLFILARRLVYLSGFQEPWKVVELFEST